MIILSKFKRKDGGIAFIRIDENQIVGIQNEDIAINSQNQKQAIVGNLHRVDAFVELLLGLQVAISGVDEEIVISLGGVIIKIISFGNDSATRRNQNLFNIALVGENVAIINNKITKKQSAKIASIRTSPNNTSTITRARHNHTQIGRNRNGCYFVVVPT